MRIILVNAKLRHNEEANGNLWYMVRCAIKSCPKVPNTLLINISIRRFYKTKNDFCVSSENIKMAYFGPVCQGPGMYKPHTQVLWTSLLDVLFLVSCISFYGRHDWGKCSLGLGCKMRIFLANAKLRLNEEAHGNFWYMVRCVIKNYIHT